MAHEPAPEVECPVCGAEVAEPCDQPLPHLGRQEAASDPGPFSAFDLDGDGMRAWEDLDDAGHRF